MKKINSKKGFTLIELLVVVAIIGILASVVLASLNTARSKGKDAKVKSQLSSMRSQGELYYNSQVPNTYTGVCTASVTQSGFGGVTGPGLLKATADATSTTPVAPVVTLVVGAYNTVTCHEGPTAWAVEAPLNTSVSGFPVMFCVDSSGQSKQETSVLAASAISCL